MFKVKRYELRLAQCVIEAVCDVKVGTLLLTACIVVSTLVARHAQKQDENLEKRWQVMKTSMMRKKSALGASLSLTSQVSQHTTRCLPQPQVIGRSQHRSVSTRLVVSLNPKS